MMKYAVVPLIAVVVILLSVGSGIMSAHTWDKYGAALHEKTGMGSPSLYVTGLFLMAIVIGGVAGIVSHAALFGAGPDLSEALGMSALFIVIAVIASAVSYRRFYG